jgi:hypothetical protein
LDPTVAVTLCSVTYRMGDMLVSNCGREVRERQRGRETHQREREEWRERESYRAIELSSYRAIELPSSGPFVHGWPAPRADPPPLAP